MNNEQIFLGGCIASGDLVDVAVSEGVRSDTFQDTDNQTIWSALVELRSKGLLTDAAALVTLLGDECPIQSIFAAEKACCTTPTAKKAMKRLVWEHQCRQIRPAINEALSLIDDKASPEAITKAVEGLQAYLKPQEAEAQTLDQLIGEVQLWAKQEMEGTRLDADLVTTGIPSFDKFANPIEAHEYVVVGARTSHGKSSFMTQLASHNLQRGLRVAYFTLETSAAATVRQIAGQRARVDLRNLRTALPEKHKAFLKELDHLKKQQLRVFDKDMSLSQIESRCRLLASSWKPHVVFLDYMGLIKGENGTAYERMGQLSKAMIPLRKVLGCALVVAAQLNRGNEKEDRAPSRTDFRDAGSIEEDAHRIIAIHRPSTSPMTGQKQELDQQTFDYELYQLKLRDGPLAHTRLKFHAPTTFFYEEKHA